MAEPRWLQPFEALLNRRIDDSETARLTLGELVPKSFGVRVHGLPGMLCLHAEAGRLRVALAADPQGLDAWVAGSVVSMGSLASGRGPQLMREGRVEIHGDAEVAEQFWGLLEAIGPEWEEELSRVTGDVAAHQLARGARALAEFATRSLDTFGRNLAEYLSEERRDLVARDEQEIFFRGVETLRDDVDRLQARLARLERDRAEPGA